MTASKTIKCPVHRQNYFTTFFMNHRMHGYNTHNFTRMEIWPSQPLNMKLNSMIYKVHWKISQSFDWNSSLRVPSILSKGQIATIGASPELVTMTIVTSWAQFLWKAGYSVSLKEGLNFNPSSCLYCSKACRQLTLSEIV